MTGTSVIWRHWPRDSWEMADTVAVRPFIPVSISVAVNLLCQESLAAGPSSIGQGQFGDLNNNKFQVVASLGFISLL